jgi:hypothetical protein
VESFDDLQSRLPDVLSANEPGSKIDHVVVALASYSVGESLLSHYVERLSALEHRYLLAQLMVNRIPGCEVLFVCSEAPTAEVVDYHGSLVGVDAAQGMRTRVGYVVVPDRSARSLAAKLLDKPDILADLRSKIGNRPALIEPWIVAEDEVAVAVALGLPMNGTLPSLRRLAYKSEGRRVFALAGVPTPIGCEDVRDIEDVLDAVDHILARSPSARAVVVKHDDSAAGDGNVVVPVRTADGLRLNRDELRDAVAALPSWYLTDLAAGGVVEELLEGGQMSSPSVQLDIRPGGGIRVLSTHEQLIGGDNGQVFMGCRFPADADYAPQLAQDGNAVAAELARCGVVGRLGIDFVATSDPPGDWRRKAVEINLRKGGTSHPYAALRNLVAGQYDAERGRWVTDRDGTARAYRSTDNVVDPAWTGRQPSSVIEAIRAAGLQFDPEAGTGVVLHMLSCLAIDGRFGATAIGMTSEHADELFEAMVDAVTG